MMDSKLRDLVKVELVSLALVRDIHIKEDSNLIDVYSSNGDRLFVVYYYEFMGTYTIRATVLLKGEWSRNTVIISETKDIEETLKKSRATIQSLM